jgi:hypothetical protein
VLPKKIEIKITGQSPSARKSVPSEITAKGAAPTERPSDHCTLPGLKLLQLKLTLSPPKTQKIQTSYYDASNDHF